MTTIYFDGQVHSILPPSREELSPFRVALDALVWVGYAFLHVCMHLATSSAGRTRRVFERDHVQAKTHNFAKFSELWTYVQLRHTPFQDTYRPQPHAPMCHGSVMTFFHHCFDDSLETMHGGVPLQGALYQKVYEEASTAWTNGEITPDFTIPPRAGFTCTAMVDQGGSADVLGKIDTLEAGAYQLAYYSYNKWGRDRGRHTVGFVVQGDGATCFYDAASCIAKIPDKTALKQTLGRLFRESSGLEYGEDSAGADPGWGAKARNFLAGRANPPPASRTRMQDFQLLKLEKELSQTA